MSSNLLDFSNRFNPIDGRDYLVSRKGRDAALSKRMRPRLLAAKYVALLGIPRPR